MVPHKDVHFLITRICEYVTLHGKRDLVNAVKVKDFETGRLSRWDQSFHMSLSQLWPERSNVRTGLASAGSEGGGRGPLEAGKGRKTDSLLEPPERDTALMIPWF